MPKRWTIETTIAIYDYNIHSADAETAEWQRIRFPSLVCSWFYYVANKSAQGAFYRANADHNLLTNEISKTEVKVLALDSNTREKLGIPSSIDLIKIDT